MHQLKAVWSIVRWAIVAVVVGGGLWLFLGMLLLARRTWTTPLARWPLFPGARAHES